MINYKGHLCSGSHDSTIRIWDIYNGICKHIIYNDSPIYSLSVLDSNDIVSSSCQSLRLYRNIEKKDYKYTKSNDIIFLRSNESNDII